LVVLALALGMLAAIPAASFGAAPTPPFNQCPAIGADTSCGILIVFNADGSITTYGDPTQGPYDGIDDTLLGVQNNSATTQTGVDLTSPLDIFDFDGDGICSGMFPGTPAGCPYDQSGYAGPNTSFTVNTPFTGRVNFPSGLKPGTSTYFSLENSATASQIAPGPSPQAAHLTLSPAAATNPTGAQHTVTATATDSGGNPVAGVTVVFTVSGANAASGSGKTDSNGRATFTYTGTNGGFDQISAFADNNSSGSQDSGEPSDKASKLWYATSANGAFVVGTNAAAASPVTFWGAQWWKLNTVTGSPGVASFKGFADMTASNPPKCGDRWTTRPGNSSNPPAGIPPFMAVIVSSKIDKSGPSISGDTRRVVVVQTNPGYAPNPGHAGTGKVVGEVCHS
jgi:hypothetical protein